MAFNPLRLAFGVLALTGSLGIGWYAGSRFGTDSERLQRAERASRRDASAATQCSDSEEQLRQCQAWLGAMTLLAPEAPTGEAPNARGDPAVLGDSEPGETPEPPTAVGTKRTAAGAELRPGRVAHSLRQHIQAQYGH